MKMSTNLLKTWQIFFVLCIGVLTLSSTSWGQQTKIAPTEVAPGELAEVKDASLGNTKNVHQVGDLFLSGQFDEADIAALKDAGIARVITLRTDGEVKWDEKKAVEDAGLEFDTASFRQPETLTTDVFDRVCNLLGKQDKKTLLHCGSANRVGAVWMAYRVLHENVPLERAMKEAKVIGLKNAGYEERAINYIKDKQDQVVVGRTEKSVRPGINDNFLADDLNPEDWIKRFEIESREIYAARFEVLKACDIKPGSRIADVGAGTGIYTRLFANQTGPDGWVFAVDISSRLLQHIMKQSKVKNQTNVTGVLCPEDSVSLPADSIDFVFICDTYHHFEYPKSTLASIHSSLKQNGRLVVIDFKRIEGESRPWTIQHVRAGQEVFQAEIEAAGFELIAEEKVPGLEENYFLKFRKK